MTGITLLSVIALWSVSWTGTEAVHGLTGVCIPEVYNIQLEPHFPRFMFHGFATIDFHVMTDTSVIAMNQKNLNVTSITMDNIEVRGWKLYDSSETMLIFLNQLLKIHNSYRIYIAYEGRVSYEAYGLYLSPYYDGDDIDLIATTQFEPTGARRVFPCWDEPEYKAIFEISITHFRLYSTVLSNMPIKQKTVVNNETFTTTFERSYPMSTYMVAFMLTDFAYKPHVDDRIKIYTKAGSVIHTDYAYNFTVRSLKVLEDYTGINYFQYITKIDQITLRTSKNVRIMENWGLVMYKEDLLLYEKGFTTTTEKEIISRAIIHGLSQQWFGNLVGLKWWDYLWLNEGFAKYFGMYILDKLDPTWRVMEIFVVDMMQWGSFVTEATTEASALNGHVVNRSDVMTAFNEVTYKKAACIIRMFSHILTEDIFRQGLRNYLKEYKLGIADSSDLLHCIGDALGPKKIHGGRTFPEIADDWVNQPGYPLVTVTAVGRGHYMLSQERFRSYDTYHNNTTWAIPINYATNRKLNFTDTTVTDWLPKSGQNITLYEPNSEWILVNKKQMGYYRVNYDENTWQTLSNVLKTDMHKIHPVNRAQLIDDMFVLARKNVTKYETAMSLTLYLAREIDYIPWMTAFKHLEILRKLMFEAEHFKTFKHYIRFIIHRLITHVTYEASPNDDHTTKILRAEAMRWACLADVKECLDSAHKHFNAWLRDPHYKLDPDLRYVIVCTGLRTASQEVWNQTEKILEKQASDRNSDRNPLQSLGCSTNEETLNKFLFRSISSDSKIDFFNAVKGVLSNTNVSGVDIVQKLVKPSLLFIGYYESFTKEMESILPTIADHIVNKDQYFKLTSFTTQVIPNIDYTAEAVEKSNRNLLWIRDYAHRIDKWLVENEQVFSSSGTHVFTSFLLILSIFMTRYF